MNIYFVNNKDITLRDLKSGNEIQSTIESPNGNGVYDISIVEDKKSVYVNGSGEKSKKYTQYYIDLRFSFSSHNMDILNFLLYDEFDIPFSFGLLNDTVETFVLVNEELVGNYFANYPVDNPNYEKGDLELKFRSSKLFKSFEILTMTYYIGLDGYSYSDGYDSGYDTENI